MGRCTVHVKALQGHILLVATPAVDRTLR
eukprot:SAG11_NODE_25081_length_364_cov_0.547170_2_plen_28_part_01